MSLPPWMKKIGEFRRRDDAVILFLAGFTAGTVVTVYLFLGADRTNRNLQADAVQDHADRWKHQHPLPPM